MKKLKYQEPFLISVMKFYEEMLGRSSRKSLILTLKFLSRKKVRYHKIKKATHKTKTLPTVHAVLVASQLNKNVPKLFLF